MEPIFCTHTLIIKKPKQDVLIILRTYFALCCENLGACQPVSFRKSIIKIIKDRFGYEIGEGICLPRCLTPSIN